MAGRKWWQQAVFYQIYPRSFADGNGDGIGDFPGMTAGLDYLHDLGIDAIWLSPHYPSPFLDCGYDIADYTAVGPEYGTLADFRAFLQAAHARNIRVILDLVLNHTSDQHPWFAESRADRINAKRDWYIWRDGQGDAPPNNWVSIFGGPAWQYDPVSGQYYYHAFLKEQPDLNWRNPAVKAAMWAAVRFWLDLGVDGFRLDAISTIFEDPRLPDHTLAVAPADLLNIHELSQADYRQLMHYQIQQPGLHELMQELRALVDEYPGDRVLVGEDEDFAFHGSGDDELQLVFNFPLLRVKRLTPAHVRANQALRLAELPHGAWPCNTLGNHDSSRVWSRYGDGVHDAALARLHLALLLTLKGTPFLYNGEEIGMADLALSDLGQFRDMTAIHHYQQMTEQLGVSPAEALRVVVASTRDRCRTPLQWSSTANAGFSPADVAPWLPVHPNYATGVNVAAQSGDPNSLLTFYRQLLRLRRTTPALIGGDYQALEPATDTALAFLRHDTDSGQTCLVALNFAATEQALHSDFGQRSLRVLFANPAYPAAPAPSIALTLAPFAVVIAELG